MAVDKMIFAYNFFSNFVYTGSLFPSSRHLAKTMIRENMVMSYGWLHASKDKDIELDSKLQKGCRILEIGPGSGILTRAIINNLPDDAFFQIVEINPSFAKHLQNKINRWNANLEKQTVGIICSDILDYTCDEPFDVIFCTIPFYNFSPLMVRKLLNKIISLASPKHSHLSFFSYEVITSLRYVLSSRLERRRLKAVSEVLKNFTNCYPCKEKFVGKNIPPARVFTLSLHVAN